jgi:tetratricopeptide (TPR) repeat protein
MNYYKYILLVAAIFVVNISISAQSDRTYIRIGNRLFNNQNYAKAEVQYRKAISKNNTNPQATYNLGCALMMQQKDSLAVNQFLKSAKLEQSKLRRYLSYHNIGVIFQKHQMYGEAITAYEQALRNNPKDDQTRYNLALCKKLLKNSKKQSQQKNNKNKKNNKQNKDKNKNTNKDKQQNKDNSQQQDKNMSKENAEQLLNAAIQEEMATQQRLKKAMRQSKTRNLQKNW